MSIKGLEYFSSEKQFPTNEWIMLDEKQEVQVQGFYINTHDEDLELVSIFFDREIKKWYGDFYVTKYFGRNLNPPLTIRSGGEIMFKTLISKTVFVNFLKAYTIGDK